jgi:nitrogen-specific signal transduction histidine kinase
MDEEKREKEIALHYMKTLIDIAREPSLILDPSLRVISANPIFYQVFSADPKQTEDKFLYELGNGQWNAPALKKLMEEILPKKGIVKNYEVRHVFETIGERTMLINARQIDSVQLVVVAIEDITDRKKIEEKLAEYSTNLEKEVMMQTKKLTDKIKELEQANKSMVGRELKMVELKKEIANLDMSFQI